jgi:hypothetical protein
MSQPAVPHTKRVHGHVKERGKVSLREIRVAAELTELVHGSTVPSPADDVKRSPEYQAGDRVITGLLGQESPVSEASTGS